MEDFKLISKYETVNTPNIQLVFSPVSTADMIMPAPGAIYNTSSLMLYMTPEAAAAYTVGASYELSLVLKETVPAP